MFASPERAFASSRRVLRPSFAVRPPSSTRGRREGRALAAPVARLQKKTQAAVTTGLAETPGLPCAMALRRPPRSPRGPAVLPPSPATRHRELGISTGMPEPHGLAVRTSSFVGALERTLRAHTATAPRLAFRDDRDTPLSSRRDAEDIARFLEIRKRNFALDESVGPAGRRAHDNRPADHAEMDNNSALSSLVQGNG
jgi:hypothetical protein